MRKIINRIGEKFGRLTVLKIKRENKCTYYYCKCDCGNELWVRSDCLVSGNTKSCGCLSKENKFETKNIQYKKFNKLTAIEPTDKRDKNNGSVIWKCKCDCGNVMYVSYGDLVFGKTKSCGCSISEVSKENIKKAYKKNIKNNVIKGTNLAAIGRKELIASAKIFKKYGLGGMMSRLFNNSIYKALNAAYPGKFKKEDFRRGHSKKKF